MLEQKLNHLVERQLEQNLEHKPMLYLLEQKLVQDIEY